MKSTIRKMRCEYLECPLGVDAPTPRLSWIYQAETEAVSFQIRVLVSPEENFGRLFWDSGWLEAEQTALNYGGEPLSSNCRVFWKAMTRQKGLPASEASAVSWFETGLLNESDWHGCWIRACSDFEAPVMTRRFTLTRVPRRARLYLCGLGVFELSVNGRTAGDEVLQPVWTAYSRQPLTHMLYPYRYEGRFRTPYRAFSLDGLLQAGENTLEVALGNGWYHQNQRRVEGDLWYGGSPVLMLELRMDEASLSSDESWQWRESETVRNNLFFGEEIDRTRGPFELRPVCRAQAPEGPLTAQLCPSDACLAEYAPVRALDAGDGRLLIDFGQNLSGWVEATASACGGDRLELRFAEEIQPDGPRWRPDFGSAGGEEQIQKDVFVFAGGEDERIHPRFCWHGYRYAEAALFRAGRPVPLTFENGLAAAKDFRARLRSILVAANLPVRGTFSCGDDQLNWFHHATRMSMRSNQHCGVPLDCPHRERLGYTGDGQVTAPAVLLNLESEAFLRKWMRDILDAQNRQTGHVPHTAPFYNGGGGPGGWGGAIVFVPWALYRFTGDASILREAFPGMLRWMEYLRSRSEGGIVVREEEGGWCLGEWCAPDEDRIRVRVEPELVNTALTIRMLELMAGMARLLGDENARIRLTKERAFRTEAFQRRFFHPETAGYGAERQGAEAFALWCGAVPEEEKNRVEEKMLLGLKRLNDHFDTGIFGTPILLELLSRMGKTDEAFRLMTAAGYPSFRQMRECGATTLYENWKGGSHNHVMFGAADTWLYEWVAGLAQAEDSAGWKKIVLRPGAVKALTQAQTSVETPLGVCALRWKRENGMLMAEARIPAMARATLLPPDGTSREIGPGAHRWAFPDTDEKET